MTTTNIEPAHKGLVTAQAAWRQAHKLLNAGQYEQTAELLEQTRLTSVQSGNIILAEILAATRQLCLACSQYQEEEAWYQQAHDQARDRESTLKQLLETILELIDGNEAPHPPEVDLNLPVLPATKNNQIEPGPLESVAYRRLWRRIQSLLGWPLTQEEHDEAGVETAAHTVDNVPASVVQPADENFKPHSLVIYGLGPFQVYLNDQLITDWNGLKGLSILKYLLIHRTTPVSKDILMELFWPGSDPEAARRNLHQAIYSLRQGLRRDDSDFQPVQFENDCYLLNPELPVWLDWEEFERHVQAGRRLEAAGQITEAVVEYGIAESLYRDDFLAEDLYEDWPTAQREHLRNLYLDLADWLSEYYLQQEQDTATVALCEKILAKDNCHETAYCRLMQCYQHQGKRRLAIRQYQLCVKTLRRELDMSPSKETQTLYEQIVGKTRSFVPAH